MRPTSLLQNWASTAFLHFWSLSSLALGIPAVDGKRYREDLQLFYSLSNGLEPLRFFRCPTAHPWDVDVMDTFFCFALVSVAVGGCDTPRRAFTNKYYKLKEEGLYCCVVCGEDLFESAAKYDSGSGWPAFYDVTDTRRVKLTKDASHGKPHSLTLSLSLSLSLSLYRFHDLSLSLILEHPITHSCAPIMRLCLDETCQIIIKWIETKNQSIIF